MKRMILSSTALAVLVIWMLCSAAPLMAASDKSSSELSTLLKRAMKHYRKGEHYESLQKLRNSMMAVWQAMEFDVPVAVMTEGDASSYSMFTPRSNNIFKEGETTIHFYVEPVGLKVTETGEDDYQMEVNLDVFLLDQDDTILFGKTDMLNQEFTFKHQISCDLYLNAELTLTGLPAGEYVIKLVTKDMLGRQQKESRFPISVVPAGASSSGAAPTGGFSAMRDRATMKACQANMLVLEGAMEMWEMDGTGEEFPGGVVDPDGPAGRPLVEEGYVSEFPRCRDGGTYSYDSATREFSCSAHGTRQQIRRKLNRDQ